MKISKNTKKIKETNTEFSCEFCNRSFLREVTMIKHLCESKRRWQDRDLPGNRIGFQVYLDFYKKNTLGKKKRTYVDFTKSAYYIMFVKFGNYCVDVKCINVNSYVDYLLKNDIKVDNWASDTNYNNFLVQYLKHEDPLDAIARSIETTIEFADRENLQAKDYLRYGNKNQICHLVTNGKISPWILYQSASGIELLSNLSESQQKYIIDYISPEQWALKFSRYKDKVIEVKKLLSMAGY